VFDRLSKKIAGLVTVGLLVAGALAQAQKAPAVKDQGEYDLTQAITKEKDPQKQLALLKEWEQKYPDSDFKGQRSLSMAQADSQIAAKGMDPKVSPADADAAQKASQDLADNIDKYLAAENKPAGATDDQWKQAHAQLEQQAHTVLATLAMNKKTPDGDATAEKEFRKVLEMSPGNASIAYTLGTLILREKNVARIPEGLFYIARAIEITGPTALTPQGKTAADTYLKKAYEGYHGADDGLDAVKKAASSSPTMPAGFTIESVTAIQAKQEGDAAAFAAANPDIALWRTIRTALTNPDGDKYLADIKGSQIPPDSGTFKMFRAKVVSQPSPKEILVNVDNAAGDAILSFETPLKGTIDAGTAMKFKGVVESVTKDPAYVLTLTADKDDVEDLPASLFAGAPAPVKKRPITKKK
jgi:hypothetical protein